MNIVIIANFCRDFSINDNGRFMYLCKELSKNNEVEIITSDFSHDLKRKKPTLENNWPFKITYIHEPGYHKNISVKRFLSHKKWGKNVEKYLAKINKPDAVYCAMPSLTAAMKVGKYCKNNNVKFIIDIQDLWPEAFLMVLNIPIISDILFLPFKLIANNAYKYADEICAVSRTYVQRALKVNKNVKNGHTVFLGTNLEHFDCNSKISPYIKKDKNDELWIGYCGSLSASYDIPCVIKALKIVNDRGFNDLKFIIMGEGNKRDEFEKIAKDLFVNVVFTGKLKYDEMCSTLCQCDIVVNPIVKRSAASIINKHGDYAASGLPVINTQESSEYRDLIDEYKMGINCENGNELDVAEKIIMLIRDKDLREKMGKASRKCAEDKFDRKNSYKELLELF